MNQTTKLWYKDLMNLEQAEVVAAAEAWVASLLKGDVTGHDMHHINRVRNVAQHIAKEENANPFLVDLMALFHELPDSKLQLFAGEEQAVSALREWLLEHNVTESDIEEIIEVVTKQSYAHSGVTGERLTSLAGRVVQDADRLDAIGAIGVARCFAYGATKGRPLYEPGELFVNNPKPDDYGTSPSSLHHFTEKLLHVKDKMNTSAGKRLAEGRHEYLQGFFDRFLREWEGSE